MVASNALVWGVEFTGVGIRLVGSAELGRKEVTCHADGASNQRLGLRWAEPQATPSRAQQASAAAPGSGTTINGVTLPTPAP